MTLLDARAATRFGVLGPVRAWLSDDGEPPILYRELELGPQKQRAVLAVLLLNANRPVSTERIIDAVWGEEPPANGANVVQKYVAGLRRALEPDRSPRTPGRVLVLTDAGYVLHVEPGHLDGDRLSGALARAATARREGRLEPAAELLRDALDLARGEPLAGLPGPWFAAARERLLEAQAEVLEGWAGLELELGRPEAVIPALRRLVGEHPLRERPRELLMLALCRSGRPAEALAAYRSARADLVELVGVEPGEALQQLHRRILAADPELAGTVAEPVVEPVLEPAGTVVEPVLEPVLEPRAGPTPAPAVAARRPLLGTVQALAVLVPCLSVGLLSWAVIGGYAIGRRSRRLGLEAAGFLALTTLALISVDESATVDSWRDGLFLTATLVCVIGGTAHAAVLAFTDITRRRGR